MKLPWQIVREPTVHYALVDGWLFQVQAFGKFDRTYTCSVQRIGWQPSSSAEFTSLDEARAWCAGEAELFLRRSAA